MKKFGTIELGIPAYMTYKGQSIGTLTKKTGSIRTRDDKKAVKLIPDKDGKLEIIDKGKRDEKGALEFGTAAVEIPAEVINKKRIVQTLTNKTKQPTRRKGVQSIRLRGMDDELGKVRILKKGEEVELVKKIMKKLDEAPIPKKDISALKAKFQMAFKRHGFKKAVEAMRQVAQRYVDKQKKSTLLTQFKECRRKYERNIRPSNQSMNDVMDSFKYIYEFYKAPPFDTDMFEKIKPAFDILNLSGKIEYKLGTGYKYIISRISRDKKERMDDSIDKFISSFVINRMRFADDEMDDAKKVTIAKLLRKKTLPKVKEELIKSWQQTLMEYYDVRNLKKEEYLKLQTCDKLEENTKKFPFFNDYLSNEKGFTEWYKNFVLRFIYFNMRDAIFREMIEYASERKADAFTKKFTKDPWEKNPSFTELEKFIDTIPKDEPVKKAPVKKEEAPKMTEEERKKAIEEAIKAADEAKIAARAAELKRKELELEAIRKKAEERGEFDNKWDWLKAQKDSAAILKKAGISGIANFAFREDQLEQIEKVKKKYPDLPLPWNQEGRDRVDAYDKLFEKFNKIAKIPKTDEFKKYYQTRPDELKELQKKFRAMKFTSASTLAQLKNAEKIADEVAEILKKNFEKKVEAPALEPRGEAKAPTPQKAKFSYDREFFKKIDDILGGKSRGVDVNLYNSLVRLQEGGDFYQTPESCLFPVLNDIKEGELLENFSESFFEPAFGFGKFTRMLIDNLPPNTSINTIDGLEYLKDTYDMIKDKIEISDLYNGDFMEFKPTKNYDLLFMNPPFEGVIEDAKGDRKREKQFWAFMVAKALMLPQDSERISYFLLPVGIPDTIRKERTRTGRGGILISNDHLFSTVGEATKKRIAKALKVDDFEEIEEKIDQLSYISSCDSFMKFGKGGKMSKLGMDTAIYKVISFR